MTIKSLGNPYDGDTSLKHNKSCECKVCAAEKRSSIMLDDAQRTRLMEEQADQMVVSDTSAPQEKQFDNSEDMLDQAIENAIVRGVFNHNDMERRTFMKAVGGGTMASILGTMLPMDSIKAAVKESAGKLEKTKLSVGFVPITCATPIIMAKPMGFYEKYGLDVDVIKTAGWAVARDKSLNKEYDASHMLTPMPLAMTMGAGSTAKPYIMPAVENINGQAIVLHNKHKDKDIQIRVVPPPEMVANLRAGNLDGYLSPDPFNQRAVWEKIGFLHALTKDIWEGHPCCAFACSKEFAVTNPNTYSALLKSIVDATQFSSDLANRKDIAKAIAPKNYLNQ